ncbi:MAG: AAA family ATPase, partial [Chitinophagaceae bacterium]|nr:AAA family ATPase [Chitinophagaceae bacterium]
PVTNQHTLFKNMRFTLEKRKLIEDLELLIIDEVSMMRCDMLDAIDHVLRHFRKKPYLPFGGVQVLYIGDLHQLPPVVKNDEWELLKENYSSPFFFDALVMQKQQPVFIELKKIYRQSDSTFIGILNNIRNNKIVQEDMEVLHQYYKPEFSPAREENYITLTSHNAKAENINSRELNKLEGNAVCFTGVISGEFNDKALPVDMNIYLKRDAQVMFLKNDKGESRRFFNGKIGVVSRLETDKIFVKFPGSDTEMEVEKETWTNIRYRINEETGKFEEEEIGSYTPLRLAWAITIHKSQGLTFEKAIIDAGASFAAGQVYVALSRLTSLDGLVLYSPINAGSVSSDPRVISFI